MPLPPEQQVRYRRVRVRRRRLRSWDRPRHLMLSIVLGACVGSLMSWNFFLEYEARPAVVTSADSIPPAKCPPVDCRKPSL